MPFNYQAFKGKIAARIEGYARNDLLQACNTYAGLTSPQQKARCIKGMMDLLDQNVDEQTRQAILQDCGRQCLGASVLKRARHQAQQAQDLDDLLLRLNQAHIGGGHLLRTEDGIQACYDRCYCGSVSQSRESFSATYCQCSCGWFRQLFETLFQRPVEVDLLSSIIQGHDRCRFLIRV